MIETPQLFRVILQVAELDAAADFYAALLGTPGRRIYGSRHYFDCGRVILALVDPTSGGEAPRPGADHLYFAVRDVEAVQRRADALGCLAQGDVHGASAGALVTRPWGERSFYAADPWGNRLCFVDITTIFTGRPPGAE